MFVTLLRALHEALVGARNIGRIAGRKDPIADIVDELERIPVLMADPDVDRTEEIIEIFRLLGEQYSDCRMAALTACSLAR